MLKAADKRLLAGAGDELSIFDVRDVVGAFLKIGRDMRRKQNAALPILHELAKQRKQILARHRIEPARRLVENESCAW